MGFDLAEWEGRRDQSSDMQGHMTFLRDTAASYSKPVVIEFGTRGGNSTSCFLAAAEAAGGQVWSVDTCVPQVPGWWHSLDRWHFLQASDTSPEAREWLPAQCDVLFIDTDHQYQHTLDELAMHLPRVRPGGVVLLHDTEWEQTGATPDECRQLDAPGGTVTAALNDWCAKTGMTWENRPGSYGIGIIRIPAGDPFAGFATDKIRVHGYLPAYREIAAVLGPGARVLELGVESGESLRLWQYLFPQGEITGVDADRNAVWPEGTIKVTGRHDDPALPAAVGGPFGLIVDDGCHQGTVVRRSFALLWSLVTPGGYYVVEDWMVSLRAAERPGETWEQPWGPSMLRAAESFLKLLDYPDAECDFITYKYGLVIIHKRGPA